MIEARFELIYPNSSLPDSKFPNLICGFPGSGYVGKLAVDHLKDELSAKHLVDIYSNTFPPQVLIKPDGTVDLIRNAIFYYESPISPSLNMMFLTGDSQPSNPDADTSWPRQFSELHLNFLFYTYIRWQHISLEYLSRSLEYFVRLPTWKVLEISILLILPLWIVGQ